MDKKLILVGFGCFLAGAILVLAIGALTHPGAMRARDNHNRDSSFNEHMHMSNGKSKASDMVAMHDEGGMGMHHDMMVTSEKDFIEQMIPHHEEAVATAKEVLARGGSTVEIKTLAQNIVSAQEKEITDMKAWYKSWYGSDYVATGNYQPMMRPLAELSGADLDQAFMSDMIMHHMGAIMMAESVEPHIEHEEITTLAANIKTTQKAEISQMETLLHSLSE